MNVEEEISAAVYCLRREYGPDCNEEMIERVVASIRRQHREEMARAVTGFIARVGNGLRRLLRNPLATATR